MPLITISAKDVKRGIIVEPGWYVVEVESVNGKTSNSGTSQNFIMEGSIIKHADTGDTKYAGVPTPQGWLFNEKAISFAIPFLAACGANVGESGGRFELEDSVGKKLEIFIENGVWEGRTVNKINHKYRALSPQNQA